MCGGGRQALDYVPDFSNVWGGRQALDYVPDFSNVWGVRQALDKVHIQDVFSCSWSGRVGTWRR